MARKNVGREFNHQDVLRMIFTMQMHLILVVHYHFSARKKYSHAETCSTIKDLKTCPQRRTGPLRMTNLDGFGPFGLLRGLAETYCSKIVLGKTFF